MATDAPTRRSSDTLEQTGEKLTVKRTGKTGKIRLLEIVGNISAPSRSEENRYPRVTNRFHYGPENKIRRDCTADNNAIASAVLFRSSVILRVGSSWPWRKRWKKGETRKSNRIHGRAVQRSSILSVGNLSPLTGFPRFRLGGRMGARGVRIPVFLARTWPGLVPVSRFPYRAGFFIRVPFSLNERKTPPFTGGKRVVGEPPRGKPRSPTLAPLRGKYATYRKQVPPLLPADILRLVLPFLG